MITYKKIILFLIVSISIFAYINRSNPTSPDKESMQNNIASKILRFHVVANSDSYYDQSVKMSVKKDVLQYLEPLIKNSDSLKTTMKIISDNTPKIISIANSTLKENGAIYTATASICKRSFPTKIYGDLTLPAGEYTALCLDLGSSSGKNWWCVLYPSLCFNDDNCMILPDESKNKLHNILTNDEYGMIMNNDSKVEFRFKIVDIIKSIVCAY